MKTLTSILDKNPLYLYLGVFVLCLVAFLTNLGLLPLFADEPTRAIVAIEMMFSENYWVPTINGEFYYKKPPFYNWIIASLFHLTGSMSEFVFRLPSVIPLFLFGFTIYYWVKKYLGRPIAFLSAAMYVTCGRMLVYASFIGHIDIFYSWVTFIGFMILIENLKKKHWWNFFVWSYVISAIAFMCKGLPTVFFQGLSIIGLLFFSKELKRFFSWQHLAGIAVFLVLVGGYFLKYLQYNSLEGWVEFLWSQSSQRTVIEKAWYETLIHLVKFPIDHLYHLAPWSLFVVFLFQKNIRREIWNNDFLKYLIIILMVNIPIYWLSPGYYPRYLFMLYPVIFIVLAYAFEKSEKNALKQFIKWVFIVFCVAMILGSLALLVFPMASDYRLSQAILICLLSITSLVLILQLKRHKYVGYVLVLITFRFGFNWIIMPQRIANNRELEYKTEAETIGKITENEELHLLHWTAINHNTTFYIERERQQTLRYTRKILPDAYHLIGEPHLEKHNWKQFGNVSIKHDNRELYLVKLGE